MEETTNTINRKVNKEGKLILKVSEYTKVNKGYFSMDMNDALLIDFKDHDKVKDMLINIRSSDVRSEYLMPVFVVGYPGEFSHYIEYLCDGIVSGEDDKELNKKLDFIHANVGQLKDLHEEQYERKTLYKLLRYMFTRNYSLNPIIDVSSSMGYVYPFLDIHYLNDPKKNKYIFEVIREGERMGLIKGEFVDKVHVCPECNSDFSNFRELCPKCGSSNLSSEYLIHHFVCANVGPERDYKKGNSLVCPKCARELRHIGVDYDRPSIVFECHDCGEFFQDPNLKSFCYNCRTLSLVNDLEPQNIQEYSISRFGVGMIKSSLFYDEYSRSILPGCYSYETFREFIHQEIRRINTMGTKAVCGAIYLDFLNSHDLGEEKKNDIVLDLAKKYHKSNASLCFFEDMFTYLLPYENIDDAKAGVLQVIEQGNEFIKSELDGQFSGIRYELIDIKIDDTEDELLNQLIMSS